MEKVQQKCVEKKKDVQGPHQKIYEEKTMHKN